MATRRQIRANRVNAKLCTGPTTEAGKQIVSQNAVRHGLVARAVVLKGESADRFEKLLASMIVEFKPETASDHALVETMATTRWRQIRNATLMTATLEIELARQDPAAGNAPVRTAHALRSLADSSPVFSLLHRYQAADSRLYSRALADLKSAKAARAAEGFFASEPQPHLSLALEGTWASEEFEELQNKTDSPENSLEYPDSELENK